MQGSMGALHLSCLARWLLESSRVSCEFCGTRYRTARHLLYGSPARAVWAWLWTSAGAAGLRIDVVLFAVMTPVTAAGAYCCLVAADFYAQAPYASLSPANWTAFALLIMAMVLVFGYFMWMYVTIRHYGHAWYAWWQSRYVIRVLHSDVSVELSVVRTSRFTSQLPAQ